MDEANSVLKNKEVRGGQVADAVGRALLFSKDMKVWQEKRSEHMVENLKCDSILVSPQTFYLRIYYTQIHKHFIYVLSGRSRDIRGRFLVVGNRASS